MRRLALLGLAVVGVLLFGPGTPPVASETRSSPPPTVRSPLPFTHKEHREIFKDVGLQCSDCHPIGLVAPEGQKPPAMFPPPRSTCHGCHLAEASAAPTAPGRCALCHPNALELKPPSHGPGWDTGGHAGAARAARTQCESCHEQALCTDCHEGRGALSRMPHGAGFRAVHGIEGRLDPQGCALCHGGDACTSCHETGATPW